MYYSDCTLENCVKTHYVSQHPDVTGLRYKSGAEHQIQSSKKINTFDRSLRQKAVTSE